MSWTTNLYKGLSSLETSIEDKFKSDNLKITNSLFDSDFSLAISFLDKYYDSLEGKYLEYSIELCYNSFNYFEESKVKEYSICNGISGLMYLNYILEQFDNNALIDIDTSEYLEKLLLEWSLNQTKANNWDYLHGSLGTINLFISNRRQKLDKGYLNSFLEIFYSLRKTNEDIIFYDTVIYPNAINLGMPHGIPSILITMIRLKSFSNNQLIDKIINDCISCLRTILRKNNSIEYSFSPLYYFDKKNIKSRIAWCYGDLIYLYLNNFLRRNGFILFNYDELVKIKNKIYKRGDVPDTLSIDNCLCHGNSGNALLESKSDLTKDFFWRNTFSNKINESDYFFNRNNEKWENNYTFLNGKVGVHQAARTLLNLNNIKSQKLLLIYD